MMPVGILIISLLGLLATVYGFSVILKAPILKDKKVSSPMRQDTSLVKESHVPQQIIREQRGGSLYPILNLSLWLPIYGLMAGSIILTGISDSEGTKPNATGGLSYFSAFGMFLLIAGACWCGGGMIGFLFSVPKQHQRSSFVNNNTNAEKHDRNKVIHNDNLTELADWLTKIIIVLALINFTKLQNGLDALSSKLSPSFSINLIQGYNLAYASIIFFSTSGFLGTYFWARLYLLKIHSQFELSKGLGNLFEPSISHSEQPVQEKKEPDSTDYQQSKIPAEAIGRRLTAQVKQSRTEGIFEVVLQVYSTDPDKPLEGPVTFHLHGFSPKSERVVLAKNNIAELTVSAVGPFTVEASADDGKTNLELNLAEQKWPSANS